MPDPLSVDFPLGGIDTAGAFGEQRPGTTPHAVNVRGTDPILERQRGGSRHGIEKYPAQQLPSGSHVVQDLNQLVVGDVDYLLATFEDYEPTNVADPSTNNLSTRNPNSRTIPVYGSGVQPNRNRPDSPRRRLAVVPSATSIADGGTLTLTVTLTRRTAGTTVAGQTITLVTQPAGRDGEGDTAVTNGSGVATFTVTESSYEGDVRYLAVHEYTPPV